LFVIGFGRLAFLVFFFGNEEVIIKVGFLVMAYFGKSFHG
jgi:hypothetical protein